MPGPLAVIPAAAAGAMLVVTRAGPVMTALRAAGGLPLVRALVQRAGIPSVRNGVQGWRIPSSIFTGRLAGLRRIAEFMGIGAIADWFIPGELFPDLWDTARALTGGAGADASGFAHPYGTPVKTWIANGVNFAKFAVGTGTMMGSQRKDGTWKYWRPKKPIVMYPGGATNLRTLLRADKATETQLKKVKKVIDRRFPQRRRSTTRTRSGGSTTIIESGPGGVRTG